jgi:hypothetical protein
MPIFRRIDLGRQPVRTNQIVHPFNGACYYNAARWANGISYCASYAVGIFGAFQWEWMGETHPMSFNDMISTGLGGAAMGEALYRFSSMILDNQATGWNRFWLKREASSPIPFAASTALFRTGMGSVPESEDDMDKTPRDSYHDTALGWRRSGNREYPSLGTTTPTTHTSLAPARAR